MARGRPGGPQGGAGPGRRPSAAYNAGFALGKAGNPKTWEFGYFYQLVEKDSQFGQFTDSDFGGGVTDTEGSVIRFGYAPAKGWVLNGTYFLNQRFIDAPCTDRGSTKAVERSGIPELDATREVLHRCRRSSLEQHVAGGHDAGATAAGEHHRHTARWVPRARALELLHRDIVEK